MVQPIKPEDIKTLKAEAIPEWIIESVNESIIKHWDGSQALIKQSEIKGQYLGEEEFDYSWLNFEAIFRDVGWAVNYNKPAYYERYEAFFTFKKKGEIL